MSQPGYVISIFTTTIALNNMFVGYPEFMSTSSKLKNTPSYGGPLSRFSTSEYFRAKRLSSFVLELSAETKWN